MDQNALQAHYLKVVGEAQTKAVLKQEEEARLEADRRLKKAREETTRQLEEVRTGYWKRQKERQGLAEEVGV